jgi:hypothetical protein
MVIIKVNVGEDIEKFNSPVSRIVKFAASMKNSMVALKKI